MYKKIFLVFLILGCITVSYGADKLSTEKIYAYYFHGSMRCPTCYKLEQYSKEAIESNFKSQLASGRLEFRVINIEEEVNVHFVNDYQLYTKALVLSLVKDGKEVRSKNLVKIWELVGNKDKFIEYIKDELTSFLEGIIMGWFFVEFISAFWLGILTSISPCPLATNIAAISFLSKKITNPKEVFISGFTYTIGRMLSYALLGWIIISSLLSVPALANLLQKYMNKAFGPILIITGLVLLDILKIKIPKLALSKKLQDKLVGSGIGGAFVLGLIFALVFCPVSAALFFGSLIPLALSNKSGIVLPFIYGIGTGLPVLLFAVGIALSVKSLSFWFNRLTKLEYYMRKITGGIFIIVGLYYTGIYIFRLF